MGEVNCLSKEEAIDCVADLWSLLTEEEQKGARKTLTAAAMTYVAALITAVAQLLRLILLFGRRDRD